MLGPQLLRSPSPTAAALLSAAQSIDAICDRVMDGPPPTAHEIYGLVAEIDSLRRQVRDTRQARTF
jgi:hypothetical protein